MRPHGRQRRPKAGRAPRAARRWWRDQNRYEEVVPERIRKLAEARGIPKPLRYIP